MFDVRKVIQLVPRVLGPEMAGRLQLRADHLRYHLQNPELFPAHMLREARLAAVGVSPLDTTTSPQKVAMLAGRPYDAQDPDLLRACDWAESLCTMFNRSSVTDPAFRFSVLQKLFGKVGEGTVVEPPFHCPYGRNIRTGRRVYFNYGCVILDRNLVVIGDEVKFGPGVLISTVNHPLLPGPRNKEGIEYALPIVIEDGVWIGMGARILPGVKRIGRDSIVAAGAVVIEEVPPSVVVGGVPARVLGTVEELAARSRTSPR
ncbi:MAG: sugar O-acetyltransferase [Candidatus Margulisiibacteriota bacterium]